ncbi:MAG: FKBP-type peptidyl-prolyl cis-trans isomerase [Catalinimonas sp.]
MVALLSGCGEQETQEQIDEGAILSYLDEVPEEAVRRSPEGVYVRIDVANPNGRAVYPEDIVRVSFRLSVLNAGDTLTETCAEDPTEFIVQSFIPLRVTRCNTAPASAIQDGFEYGVLQMREGEKGEILVPSRFAYGGSVNAPVPPNSVLRYFDVTLEEVR